MRYVCPLPQGALSANTIYRGGGDAAANRTYTLPSGSALIGGTVGALVVAGDGVVVCDVVSRSRVTVTGTSARDVVIHGVTVAEDDVAVAIVGASPKVNSIDVTGLALTDIRGGPIAVAAAHAQADTVVRIPCSDGETVLLQPLVPNANITAQGCKLVDLAVLLDVFGRPYEVSKTNVF